MKTWRHLSIARKLPLGIVAILALTLGAMAAMGYVEVRRSAIAVAAERLDGQTRQLANILETSAIQRLTQIDGLGEQDLLTAYLDQLPDTVPPAVLDSLASYAARNGPVPSMEIWDRELNRVAVSGDTFPPISSADATRLVASIPETGTAIGPFVGTDTLRYAVIVRVGDPAEPRGYVLERRPVANSPDAVRQLRGLMGDAEVVVGSPAFSPVWTDLSGAIEGPPDGVVREGVIQYSRSGRAVIAVAVPIGRTPWLLLGELPSGEVLLPARRFLARAGVLTVALVLVGGLLGWTMSRRITRPLEQLTVASERIAEGDTSSRVTVDRPDELGRLSASYNTMALRIGEMQADLLRLVGHYRPLFERNPLPMWLAEPATRRVLEVNDAAVAHYGYDRDTFVRMSARDFVIQSKPHGRDGMRLERHALANGVVIDVEVTRHALVEDGRDVFLVLANDVTQRLHADRTLKEFNAELERRVAERTAELASANQELEAFSYSVSHDLRAPLRAIHGFARIMEEDHAAAIPSEARECLSVISSNARRMGELIDDLLHLARLARKPLVRIQVDMTELAHSLAFETRTSEPGRQLHFEIGELPPADGEPALVRQALANLIQNASKFSVRRESARIQIGHSENGEESVYFVRDNGVGFDMEYADKLFGVFQRLHTDEEFDGTGVGLAIVERIVHRHGGRVWAESEPGVGATFYFTLPSESANT